MARLRGVSLLSLVAGGLLAVVSTGCAQSQMSRVNDTYMSRDGDRVTLSAPPAERVATAQALLESTPYSETTARQVTLPRVPTPVAQIEAKTALEHGLAAMSDEDWTTAASQFRAVLRTDFLTDAGRANIYWFTAEAHRRLHDIRGEADALSGFLLAASILDDDTVRADRREVAARAALAAFRLSRDPDFGRTKDMPIRVMDTREPTSIMSALGCQTRAANDTVVSRSGGVALMRQSARCGDSGAKVHLWFDVSEAKAADR